MIQPESIRWGAYSKFEGPFFGGTLRYLLPSNPDFWDIVLATITATEGGCFDAINMYDRCILSVGLIQWCEAAPVFSVSKMLGMCGKIDSFLFESHLKKFPNADASFKTNSLGAWRWFFKGQEVTTQELQRHIFLGGSNIGFKPWEDKEAASYAKKVAAWFASIWEHPLFRQQQLEFTKSRLPEFVMPEAKKILFSEMSAVAQTSWRGATRAAFCSFAANLPKVANNSMIKAAAHPEWVTADAADRFRIALQTMTFGPGISIYPERYEKIAPVLKKVFNVDIPLTAKDLKIWDDAPPVEEAHHYSKEELAHFERLLKISDDVRLGRNVGIEVLEHMLEET